MHAKSVRWPKAPQERRDAWPLETGLRVRDVINPRNRIAVVLGLGCGLRQGAVFGLSPDDFDYARGVLHVRRQVQAIHGRLYFTLPKGKKTRVVDMPSSVAEELKHHVEAFPPVKVELACGKPEAEGQRRKFSLSSRRVSREQRTGSGRLRRRMASMCCGTPMHRSCWRRESPW